MVWGQDRRVFRLERIERPTLYKQNFSCGLVRLAHTRRGHSAVKITRHCGIAAPVSSTDLMSTVLTTAMRSVISRSQQQCRVRSIVELLQRAARSAVFTTRSTVFIIGTTVFTTPTTATLVTTALPSVRSRDQCCLFRAASRCRRMCTHYSKVLVVNYRYALCAISSSRSMPFVPRRSSRRARRITVLRTRLVCSSSGVVGEERDPRVSCKLGTTLLVN